MKSLIITDLKTAPDQPLIQRSTHWVSFRDDGFQYPELTGIIPETNWLRLFLPDQYADPGSTVHRMATTAVIDLVKFCQSLPVQARLGLNCRSGISRSTAAGLICAVHQLGFDRGTALFWASVRMAYPNETLIEIGDQELLQHGKLIEYCGGLPDRFMSERGLLIPKNLLHASDKSAAGMIDMNEIDDGFSESDILAQYGSDPSKED